MASTNPRPGCPICNDTDCVCPQTETSCGDPPQSCPICGDTDCVCPDYE